MGTVIYESDGPVALITIDREEKRNALDLTTCAALMDCWDRIESSDAIQVGVVTGAGSKAFCAGFDIGEKRQDGRPNLEDFSPRLGTHARVTKPLIAAVNGPAVAAGVALVEACDLCIAGVNSWFALNEVRLGIGLHPFVQSLWSLPVRVLMEMLITGEPLPAGRAYDIGFVNKVVPDDEVVDAALEMAQMIARNAPLVVRASKRMILEGEAAMGMEEALAAAVSAFAEVSASADAREGFAARAEGRPPVWRGA